MKKRMNKKLILSRETVSNLNNDTMSQVKGGNITFTCPQFGCDTNYKCTIGCLSLKEC